MNLSAGFPGMLEAHLFLSRKSGKQALSSGSGPSNQVILPGKRKALEKPAVRAPWDIREARLD